MAWFRATVEVEPYRYAYHSDLLLQTLRDAGVFQVVAPVGTLPDGPDFVARIEQPPENPAFVEPMATFVTLGIVPTTLNEEHGFAFSLAPPDRPDDRVHLDYRFGGESTMGWWALLLNLSPDRGFEHPHDHERFSQGLAAEVFAHREEIEAAL